VDWSTASRRAWRRGLKLGDLLPWQVPSSAQQIEAITPKLLWCLHYGCSRGRLSSSSRSNNEFQCFARDSSSPPVPLILCQAIRCTGLALRTEQFCSGTFDHDYGFSGTAHLPCRARPVRGACSRRWLFGWARGSGLPGHDFGTHLAHPGASSDFLRAKPMETSSVAAHFRHRGVSNLYSS